MKKMILCTIVCLITGTAWSQDDFQKQAKRNFSSSILDTVTMSGNRGEILFKDIPTMPDYFRTGDKINKIFAIESARLFREVSDLEILTMTIPLKEKTYSMSISRNSIEDFYNLKFSSMKGDLNAWRNNFVRKYDSKKLRAKFAKRFVESY